MAAAAAAAAAAVPPLPPAPPSPPEPISTVVDVVDVDVVGASSSIEEDDDVTMGIGEPLPLHSGGSSGHISLRAERWHMHLWVQEMSL